MAKYFYTILFSFFIATASFGQMKVIPNQPTSFEKTPADFKQIKTNTSQSNLLNTGLKQFSSFKMLPGGEIIAARVLRDEKGLPTWIEHTSADEYDINRSERDQALSYLEEVKSLMLIDQPQTEFRLVKTIEDEDGRKHIRLEQTYEGIPIYGSEIIAHTDKEHFFALNGAWYPTPNLDNLLPHFSASQAQTVVGSDLQNQGIEVLEKAALKIFPGATWEHELAIYHLDRNAEMETLAWVVSVRPNYKDHWKYVIDAATGRILSKHNHICSFFNPDLIDKAHFDEKGEGFCTEISDEEPAHSMLGGDGPQMTTDTDLSNQNRLVHSYSVGNTFYMIDATRNLMYKEQQSTMPNEPAGVIWTIDAQGTSPQNQNFSYDHAKNTNNNWKSLEVSAHSNGGVAYEYFLNTFGRNSINGGGGNIISIINVTDENENEMDNAFWNGVAMFYGNGIEAFNSPLAKAEDVAGHEMSHGVIQNTANLDYVSQSGALNESFADIFGAMIDRDDWKMGEDVVNTSIFQTGALRDLQNPNNGGSQFGDLGWQPKHMNEYKNLPNTPQGDNGGVHINSGIPNRAYYLFATEIGKSKAEQIYYKALRDYLVKSSQFVDVRNAVVQAAEDLHGEGSNEVSAAKNAFEGVGIGEGEGGSYQEDLNVNPGDDFIIATDNLSSALYYIPPSAPGDFVQLTVPAPLSRPSITDDGSAAVYVDQNNFLQVIEFDFSSGLDYEVYNLENSPQSIWRNIVISKDGSKIAYVLSELKNEIFIYDFASQQEETFTLKNPTSADGGITTGDVLFADVMEFDYSGEFIMYDAFNRISGSFGDAIDYWDISFVEVWDNSSNSSGSGQINKLFTALPENISVGNATFSKNSPYIIAFDLIENERDFFNIETANYYLKAANIQSGKLNDVFVNDTLSYPSYSRLDDRILFDSKDPNNSTAILLATIEMDENDKTVSKPGTAIVFVEGGSHGVWSQTGDRELNTGIDDQALAEDQVSFYPNPTDGVMQIEIRDLTGSFRLSTFNQLGQLINQQSFEVFGQIESKQVDLSAFAHGMYEIQLTGETGTISKKIFKQ